MTELDQVDSPPSSPSSTSKEQSKHKKSKTSHQLDQLDLLDDWQRRSLEWKVSYEHKVHYCLEHNQLPVGPIEFLNQLNLNPPHPSPPHPSHQDHPNLIPSGQNLHPVIDPQTDLSNSSLNPDSPPPHPANPVANQAYPPLQSTSYNRVLAPPTPSLQPPTILISSQRSPGSPQVETSLFTNHLDHTNQLTSYQKPKTSTPVLSLAQHKFKRHTRVFDQSSFSIPSLNLEQNTTNSSFKSVETSRQKSSQKQLNTLSDYDKLSSKEKSLRFPNVQTWALFLNQVLTNSEFLSANKKKKFMTRCRVYYLLNLQTSQRFNETDRKRMRRLAEAGAHLQSELRPGQVTHIVIREEASSWKACLEAIHSVVKDSDQRKKIISMCLAPPDKSPGEELIWVLTTKWIEACLINQAIPAEKHMRIGPSSSIKFNKALLNNKKFDQVLQTFTQDSNTTESETHPNSSFDEIETSISLQQAPDLSIANRKPAQKLLPHGLELQVELARLGEGNETEDEDHPAQVSAENINSSSVIEKKPHKKNTRYACDRPGGGKPNKIGPNEDICNKLEQIIELYGGNPHDQFRILNLRKAIGILRAQTKRVDNLEVLNRIEGIGSKTAQKIYEIAHTGTHRRLQLATDEDICRKLFAGIHGVGDTLARKWYKKGLRTLEDVRERKAGIQLSASQEIGLRFYQDLQEKIPRKEVELIFERITPIASKIDNKLQLYLMGSYRRGQETCSDIDIIVTRDDSDGYSHVDSLQPLHSLLKQTGLVTFDLSLPKSFDKDNSMFMGLCSLNQPGYEKQRRIDILGVPYQELGAAFIYFTGNDIFNRSIRLKARHMGYVLNQKGLFERPGQDHLIGRTTSGTKLFLVASRTEEEIFNILKVKYLLPHERNV
ncbi:hypothetical protein O181_002122 [Austropuccinia psidii MF-1]|uniref:DNA-directed DNA polymerase n=1 Tax=Austropuccinia psidii MF-1 TaxID=1389203 RepID=A0A9Q3BC71_9BASI|nr:hypothetical protein [Austropuccinia psidii MF-1]